MKIHSALLILVMSATLALPAQAERADRGKPIQIESQRITVDDAKKIQVMEGDVVLTQGTLVIKSDKIVITQDKYGFQKGVATGGKDGLARIRQKRDGKDEYIEGEAERIEYNTQNEVAELFRRAWVKTGDDQVKGDYIWYDSISEKYKVTAGETRDPKAPPQRVRVTIQPKNKGDEPGAPPAKNGTPLELKEADKLDKQPQREE